MKKIIGFILCLGLCVGLVGCGSRIPEGMDKDDYEICKKILDTTNDYINGSINQDEAHSDLDSLIDRISNSNENHETTMISIIASEVSYGLLKPEVDIDDIKSNRDEIENYLK